MAHHYWNIQAVFAYAGTYYGWSPDMQGVMPRPTPFLSLDFPIVVGVVFLTAIVVFGLLRKEEDECMLRWRSISFRITAIVALVSGFYGVLRLTFSALPWTDNRWGIAGVVISVLLAVEILVQSRTKSKPGMPIHA